MGALTTIGGYVVAETDEAITSLNVPGIGTFTRAAHDYIQLEALANNFGYLHDNSED